MSVVEDIGAVLRGFNRRNERRDVLCKLKHRHRNKTRNGYYDSICYFVTRLLLKREVTQKHLAARFYKRLFRGVCGAMTWRDLAGRAKLGGRGTPPYTMSRRDRRQQWRRERKAFGSPDWSLWVRMNRALQAA